MATTILAIETSCDETAAAVVTDGRYIRASIIASQVDLHAPYGGVFPEVASRAHVETIYPVIQQALATADTPLADLDAIAVTQGPGLAGSLLVGINAAQGLALASGKPLYPIHHLEGHIYAQWLTPAADQLAFPLLVLIVSGGHTELLLMTDHRTYTRLGGTLDDAVGEAFDKVGRLFGLPYPGGPHVERAAQSGDPTAFAFTRARLPERWDFSFSGLKTAVLYELHRRAPGWTPGQHPIPPNLPVADLAASFQAAAVEALVEKTARAAHTFHATSILITGGVSANQALRTAMAAATPLPVHTPPLALCGDNAAMIAAAAYRHLQAGLPPSPTFDVRPTWPLTLP